jgi:hypothetical protein
VSVVGLSDRSKKKGKPRVSKMDMTLDLDKDDQSFLAPAIPLDRGQGIQVMAIYDSLDHLVQLKFLNNKWLPRTILSILNLIIQYHEYLTTIVINKGLDEHTLYDISKFLPLSHITDICLDNTYLKEANYYLLFEKKSLLRHLSLSRCSITDVVVESIAAALSYPLPGSIALSVLNLSSNRITDVGAKYLAEALRSNRHLSYLNLSDNNLTDCGGENILSSLQKFPLTFAELLASRSRHMYYLKEKNELAMKIMKNLRAGDFDKRNMKRRAAVKPVPPPKKKGLERELSAKSAIPENRSLVNIDNALIEKAANMAENTLGEFRDPFDKDCTYVEDGIVYSEGNNTLCYLNLAYNNLTYMTLRKLLDVMTYQREISKRSKGLINVSIEGNCMPIACKELSEIESLIQMNLMLQNRRYSTAKKRPSPKSGAR